MQNERSYQRQVRSRSMTCRMQVYRSERLDPESKNRRGKVMGSLAWAREERDSRLVTSPRDDFFSVTLVAEVPR